MKSKSTFIPPKFILVHNTNGDGYSDITVKDMEFRAAVSYADSVFKDRESKVEFNDRTPGRSTTLIYTEQHTNKNGDTERVSIFEIAHDSIALVKVNALLTDHEVIEFKARKEAKKELDIAKEIITEPDEESTDYKVFGDGDDGYYYFEVL